MAKIIIYNGRSFCYDGKGYYYNSSLRKRLHQVIWEQYNGPLPDGCEIHHKDFDRENNDISNLVCLSSKEHKKLHADSLTDEQRDWRRENMNMNARPKAVEWHKSKNGKAWHSEHIRQQHEKGVFEHELTCTYCGKTYTGILNGENHFCSNKCKSAYRRKQGLDNVVRKCVVCGKEFSVNKYAKAVTCSRSCTMKRRWQNADNKSQS